MTAKPPSEEPSSLKHVTHRLQGDWWAQWGREGPAVGALGAWREKVALTAARRHQALLDTTQSHKQGSRDCAQLGVAQKTDSGTKCAPPE